jgi:hypothetical protein
MMLICLRCGCEDLTGQIAKRVERHTSQLCSSCRARPAEKVDSVLGKCKPHKGDFDLDKSIPLDIQGTPFMPGYRRCGNADCVEPEHIVPEIEFERISITYRTGIRLAPDEQMKILAAEVFGRRKRK